MGPLPSTGRKIIWEGLLLLRSLEETKVFRFFSLQVSLAVPAMSSLEVWRSGVGALGEDCAICGMKLN